VLIHKSPPAEFTGMLVLSPEMEAYEKSLLDELHRAIAIAKEARKKGLDPTLDVEIPIASDLADRVSMGDMEETAIEIRNEDEIGDLAASFGRMIVSMKYYMEKAASASERKEEA